MRHDGRTFGSQESQAMQRFLERHREAVLGVLSGFDRVLFRGTLRSLEYLKGFDTFLQVHHVLYKDFGGFVERLSNRVKEHARQFAKRHGQEVVYLQSSSESKEDRA